MNMLKKAVFAPVVALAFISSVHANPIDHTVQLTATVPSSDFNVGPKDNDWIGNPQALAYNAATDVIASFTKPFDAKHTAGAISGILSSKAVLVGSNTGENIDLVVKFNSATLNETTATQVLTAAEAAPGKVVNLDIAPVKPTTGGYIPDTYTGNVNLSFDAVAP